MNEKSPLSRNCPKCGKIVVYRYKGDCDKAVRRNSLCKQCSAKNNASKRDYRGNKNPFWGKTHSRETIDRIQKGDHSYKQTAKYRRMVSKQTAGSSNPMYGKSVYDVWIEKYGKEEADIRRQAKRNKVSEKCSGTANPMYGKPAPRGAGQGWKGWYKGWFFRSLKELSYVINVLEKGTHNWKSAETRDLSIHFVDWRGHDRTYRADFLVDDKRLVEVKPSRLMSTPTNLAKRKAAGTFCAARGYEYIVEESVPLTTEEITSLWKDQMIVFQERYDKMFRERYVT